LLADPTRRRIIAAVAVRPRRPSSLAAELGLSRPAMSRQLRLLREAELIKVSRSLHDRRVLLYAIDRRAHGPITAWLAGTNVGRRPALTIDADGVVREDQGGRPNVVSSPAPVGADEPAVLHDGSA
jgi:DNA-binding transcriptional ArsR family regulator